MTSIFKQISSFATVIFGVLLLTFLLIHLVPGDPVEVMLGESASTADRDMLRADLGRFGLKSAGRDAI